VGAVGGELLVNISLWSICAMGVLAL